MRVILSLSIALLLLGAMPLSAVRAQDDTVSAAPDTADQQPADPPARVGSLDYIEGDVSQFDADQNDWSTAQLNFPVTTDNAFATGADGRAEFELGGAMARIGNGTELDIVALDEGDIDLRLPQGMVSVHLAAPPADSTPVNTVITTPRGDVSLAAPGRYLIDAGTEDQPTVITVYDGGAQITDAAGATFNVAANQAGVLTGDSNQPAFATQSAQANALETWAQQREQKYVVAPLPAQVSPAMTGVATLAAYGDWQTDPQYGPVWYPRGLDAGWQPYSQGHWAYIRPWGWTWVDNAPWGFAPFHYGRWVRVRNGWGWAPGAVVVTPGVAFVAPIYAPALVVFADIAAGPGGPGVAWYPLGWNEPYIPAYRVSRAYIAGINVRVVEQTRIVQVTNVYNRIYERGGHFDPYAQLQVGAYRGNAIAMPRTAFGAARPVAQVAFKPPATQLTPMMRPTGVTAPRAKPHAALTKSEPPKPKVLPAAKRAPIPQKLMAPKKGTVTRPTPAAATTRPGMPPNQAKPEAKPAVTTPPKAPETATEARLNRTDQAGSKPASSKPEAKPEAKPEVKPAAKPEVKPEAKRLENRRRSRQ